MRRQVHLVRSVRTGLTFGRAGQRLIPRTWLAPTLVSAALVWTGHSTARRCTTALSMAQYQPLASGDEIELAVVDGSCEIAPDDWSKLRRVADNIPWAAYRAPTALRTLALADTVSDASHSWN